MHGFIHEYVDLIIVIDWKFRYFEDDHEISSDNSRDVVESFSNSVYCSYPNLTEIEKRNKYLEFAGDKNMDFLIVIDSDEFAVVNEVDFLINLDKLRNSKINSNVTEIIQTFMESRFLRSISKNQISLEIHRTNVLQTRKAKISVNSLQLGGYWQSIKKFYDWKIFFWASWYNFIQRRWSQNQSV